MTLKCPNCPDSLSLDKEESANYTWGCNCGFVLDTGVPIRADLVEFLKIVGNRPDVQHWGGYVALDHTRFADAKRVYMPQALGHFIDCSWGGCYNGVYRKTIQPIDTLEYTTKTAVLPSGAWRTRGGGLMYSDLYNRLLQVDDSIVAEHMKTNCNPRSADD